MSGSQITNAHQQDPLDLRKVLVGVATELCAARDPNPLVKSLLTVRWWMATASRGCASGVLTAVLTRERASTTSASHKALGMTPRQTVAMVIASVVVSGLVGGTVGVPVGMALHRAIVPAVGASASVSGDKRQLCLSALVPREAVGTSAR